MEEDDEWELCNDDGFVYKRKRRRLDPAAVAAEAGVSSATEAEQENRRRERKKRTLLKLKAKYEKEIREWDTLSNTLRSTQNAAFQLQQQRASEEQTRDPSSLASTSSTDSVGGSLLDELLLQVNVSWKLGLRICIVKSCFVHFAVKFYPKNKNKNRFFRSQIAIELKGL